MDITTAGLSLVGLLQAWQLASLSRIETKLDNHINEHAKGSFSDDVAHAANKAIHLLEEQKNRALQVLADEAERARQKIVKLKSN